MAHDPYTVIKTAARRAGLRCARQTTLVEVVRGPTQELGERKALLCRDTRSLTGVTATINYHGRVVFVPYGKRNNHHAWAVPSFLAHSAVRATAEYRRRAR
jgi:hypothetical protein